LNLPSELRNKIFELVLVRQAPIPPWNDWDRLEEFTVGLLRANRTVLSEASSIFYAQNHFDLTMGTTTDILSFFEQIGSNNAACIRHICVEFPTFRCLELGKVSLSEDSISVLASIHNYCTNLSTITTDLGSTHSMEVDLDALDDPSVVSEALKLVHACFKAISSTSEIIVEVYKDGPSDHIRNTMKSHGWTINTTEYDEEEDWRGRGLSDESFDYSGNYCDEDYDDEDYGDEDYDVEYDIDNDSDFWRRAGD
jgi:hypothetical protein